MEDKRIIALEGRSSAAVAQAARRAEEADSAVVFLKTGSGEISSDNLDELAAVAVGDGVAMAYSDYVMADGTTVELIDRHEGALRDDFDFGEMIAVPTTLFVNVAASLTPGLCAAGFYELILALSRRGEIVHLPHPLYMVGMSDDSTVSQFDYVDPRNRESQIEMESVATRHLELTGALVDPASDYVPISEARNAVYPVEASVIIPVRNRVSTIDDAVRSALSQQTDFAFNVIVVDNFSTDGTTELLESLASADARVVHIVPAETGRGIGGCWNIAVNRPECGRYAVQLDSDDLYASYQTLQLIVDEFRSSGAAMVVGSYMLTDFNLEPIPPGVIDHREWTDINGMNNALRINGFGAPRAFRTDIIRRIGFPDVSYGEDYAAALAVSRRHRIARIYEPIYLCRRWEGNSDASPTRAQLNANNLYKDSVRTAEINARKRLTAERLENIFDCQMRGWDAVASAYSALASAPCKQIEVDGARYTVRCLESRSRSTNADVSPAAIAARPCFLCRGNRPAEQHVTVRDDYEILVNPYPILNPHYTIVARRHTPQRLAGRVADMAMFARDAAGMTVFFNGASSGASAPDHFHFQMVRSTDVPAWTEPVRHAMRLSSVEEVERFVAVEGSDMLNLLCRADGKDRVEFVAFRRRCHRPADWDTLRVSPASLDLAGCVVVARRKDFDNLDSGSLRRILDEVCYPVEGNTIQQ